MILLITCRQACLVPVQTCAPAPVAAHCHTDYSTMQHAVYSVIHTVCSDAEQWDWCKSADTSVRSNRTNGRSIKPGSVHMWRYGTQGFLGLFLIGNSRLCSFGFQEKDNHGKWRLWIEDKWNSRLYKTNYSCYKTNYPKYQICWFSFTTQTMLRLLFWNSFFIPLILI